MSLNGFAVDTHHYDAEGRDARDITIIGFVEN